MAKKPEDIGAVAARHRSMSFFDHLDELRVRLIRALIAFVIVSCVFYSYIDPLFHWIVRPVGQLVFTSPSEAFVARVLLALWGGFFFSLPVTLFEIWQFVASGLKEKERKYILVFGPCSLVLFLLGGIFAYIVAVPMALKFLLSFSSDWMVPMITVKNYISFIGTFMLGFGVVFELPLILMFLTKIGIATPEFLIQKRRHAIVLLLIISAVLTPPDVVSLLIMSVPLIVLYEVGIIVSKMTYRSK